MVKCESQLSLSRVYIWTLTARISCSLQSLSVVCAALGF